MSSRNPERRRRLALLGVLALAATLRAGWALAVDVDPRRDFHYDMTWYDLAALRVAEGALLRDGDGTPTAFWPPGYPLLLGAAYAVVGEGPWVGKLLNVALGTATVLLTFALGARLFGGAVGLGAAALVALWPGDVFYAPLLLSEVPYTTLLAGLLLAFAVGARREAFAPWPYWLGFGALCGVAALTRGTGSLFPVVPVAAAWLGTRSPRRALRLALPAALGMLAIVLPWTLRNARVMGAPVFISTSVGMSFLYAHNPIADGSETLRMVRYRDELLRPLRDVPPPRREIEELRTGVREALRFARENPGRELALIPRRWLHLYRDDHAGLRWASPARSHGERPPVVSEGWDRRLAGVADAYFYAILVLAAWGLVPALRAASPGALALPLTWAYVSLLHGLLFVGDPRYHAPLVPVLAILAALGVAERPLTARRLRRASLDV